MRKTKIICTMGPACANEETLTALFEAGMNVARLNFSHGDFDEHLGHITRIRKIRQERHIPVAILLEDRKSTRLNSSHTQKSRMPSSA